jgi:FkbM family methyltransferase
MLSPPIFKDHWEGHSLRWFTPNNRTLWRAETLHTKEPDTLNWLRTLGPASFLLDIGANVGLYSILAGFQGARVAAVEPESGNYAILNRNIAENHLDERVRAYCLAVSDRSGLDTLMIPKLEAGCSLNTFGDRTHLERRSISNFFSQGGLGVTLDQLVYDFLKETPTHIKIDVDGIEDRIVRGGERTWKDPKLNSVLIEIDRRLDSHLEIEAILKREGFRLIDFWPAGMEKAGSISNSIFTRSI